MKTFLEYSSVKATDGTHIDEDGNLMDLSDDSVVEKLNAFVGSIGMKEYLVPEKAVDELRQKLMRVGLQFGATPVMEGNKGNFSLPLSLFGGRFGKDENTPFDEFLNDDGISHNVEGGLKMNFTYEMQEDNTCKITAKIA